MTQSYFNRKGRILFAVVLFSFLCIPPAFAESLIINLIAVNASPDKVKEIEVKYPLPEELRPEHILDSGELHLDYDVDKGIYLVQGKITFQPKESRTFKISVQDVWVIDTTQINELKTQLEESLEILKTNNFEHYEMAEVIQGRIFEQLDSIFAKQESYSENIERRIEEYRSRKKTLDRIRSDIYGPDFLRNEAIAGAKSATEDSIMLVIEVQNPSSKDKKTVKHKHYLPKEIRGHDVLDRSGFDVRFDPKTERAFLSKEEVFLPGETKKYTVAIRDIWSITEKRTDALQARGEAAFEHIRGSEYDGSGGLLLGEVTKALKKIRDTQQEETSIKQHIGIFRVNQQRYDEAQDMIVKMEKMVAMIQEKKLAEFEKRQVENILRKLRALRGVKEISEALFKKGVSVTATWRIILVLLGLVFLFTGGHFLRWYRRSTKMGEESAAAEIKVVPKPGEQEEKEDNEEEE